MVAADTLRWRKKLELSHTARRFAKAKAKGCASKPWLAAASRTQAPRRSSKRTAHTEVAKLTRCLNRWIVNGWVALVLHQLSKVEVKATVHSCLIFAFCKKLQYAKKWTTFWQHFETFWNKICWAWIEMSTIRWNKNTMFAWKWMCITNQGTKNITWWPMVVCTSFHILNTRFWTTNVPGLVIVNLYKNKRHFFSPNIKKIGPKLGKPKMGNYPFKCVQWWCNNKYACIYCTHQNRVIPAKDSMNGDVHIYGNRQG